MMTIPTLDAPRVSSSGLGTPFERTNRSADESPWSPVGALADAGSQVMLAVQKAKKEADALAVREALNKQQKFLNAGLEEIRRAEGKNALKVAADFYAKADVHAKEMYGKLGNEQQRAAFTLEADENLTQVQRIGETHAGQQIKIAEEKEHQIARGASFDKVAQYGDAPGVVDGEAAAARRRTLERAGIQGIGKDEAEILAKAEVGEIYMVRAKVLANNPNRISEARALLQAHPETGLAGQDMLGKLDVLGRNALADSVAGELEKRFALKDGSINTTEARKQIDQMFEPGPQRDAAHQALDARATRAKEGVAAREGAAGDALLETYQAHGRSYWEVQKTPAWTDATPQQRENLYQSWKAAERAKQGDPLTPAQVKARGSINLEFATRPDYWGSVPQKKLEDDPRYNMLPPALQAGVMADFTKLHQDRANPASVVQSLQGVILSRAQLSPLLSSTKDKKGFNEFDAREQSNWNYLYDEVYKRTADWNRQDANQGKRVPNAVVEGWVDEISRSGTMVDGGWGFKDKKISKVEYDALPPEEREGDNIFIPDYAEGEEALGRRVLYLQGVPEKMQSKEKIMGAAQAQREARSGPSPEELVEIKAWLRKHGRDPDDQGNIQMRHEWVKLKYVRVN
jgi:hypothetical protein